MPVRTIWVIVNNKLPTYYRSADAVFTLKGTVNWLDEAPAVRTALRCCLFSNSAQFEGVGLPRLRSKLHSS